jgi:magnesium-transporting ATPase (P-type)
LIDITNDNLATIVSAAEQGRVVYANLKKVSKLPCCTGVH